MEKQYKKLREWKIIKDIPRGRIAVYGVRKGYLYQEIVNNSAMIIGFDFYSIFFRTIPISGIERLVKKGYLKEL